MTHSASGTGGHERRRNMADRRKRDDRRNPERAGNEPLPRRDPDVADRREPS